MSKKQVIKASAAIHTSNKISFLQRRAWNVLLANAYDDLPIKDEYQVNIQELCEVLNFDSKNDIYLKTAITDLVNLVIEWNILEKDKNEWGVAAMLADVVIKNNILTYSYGASLRKKLHSPAMYARLNLAIQNRFNSKHSLALYELFVDYFDIKRNYGETPWIDIPNFRNLIGLKEDEYTDFKHLNKRVIKEPINEINDKSDLVGEVAYQKRKKKIVAIKFYIRKNPNKKNFLNLAASEEVQDGQLPALKTEQLSLFERLEKFGLTPAQAERYSKEYDSDNINKIIDTVEEKFKTGKIKNITAYTITSLKNSAPQFKAPIEIDKENKAAINEKKKELAEQHKMIMEQLQQRFHNHKAAKINEIISNEVDKEKIFKEFEIQLKKDPSYEFIKSVNSPDITQILFKDYLANNYLEAEDNSFIKWARKKGYKIQQEQSGGYVFVK